MTSLLRPSVLFFAALVSAPALWEAFGSGSLDVNDALVRFLIAVPLCALARALILSVGGSAPDGTLDHPGAPPSSTSE
jgi:hypothetical protein